MNLKSTRQEDSQGAVRVKVVGTLNGKRRQLTVPANPNKGPRGQHGSAAGQFVAKFATHDQQKAIDTAIITGRSTWKPEGRDVMTFTFPDN